MRDVCKGGKERLECGLIACNYGDDGDSGDGDSGSDLSIITIITITSKSVPIIVVSV